MQRTLASQTVNKTGERVKLLGWVDSKRDHGKLVFVDLRDRSGIVQVVGDQTLARFRHEDVVEIIGRVVKRPKKLINPDLPTGIVEIQAEKARVITKALDLPFPIHNDGYGIEEALRLKYRYLDLRRPRMQKNLWLRHQFITSIREFLNKKDFIEIETPILSKSTPEGARDFLVPSRLQPGKFYALPQSPQQYKQLLMVAGFERYFQIARVFRDEDPRADRAYGEFTQLDLEMAFVEQDDILRLTEELFNWVVGKVFPEKHITQIPWPRISWNEAMDKYGTDKPDLRRDKKDKDELAFVWIVEFPLFTKQTEEDYFYGPGKARFAPSHHMFTAPHPEDIGLLDKDPLKVRSLQHDLVLNGFEVGGGSMRIHDPEIQEKVFDLIGFSDKEKKMFSHLLDAFKYGVPPHGGIAPGIDRFLMVVLGEPSLREVIAFPTSASGHTAVMDAPSVVDDAQLKELGIKIVEKINNGGAKKKEEKE